MSIRRTYGKRPRTLDDTSVASDTDGLTVAASEVTTASGKAGSTLLRSDTIPYEAVSAINASSSISSRKLSSKETLRAAGTSADMLATLRMYLDDVASSSQTQYVKAKSLLAFANTFIANKEVRDSIRKHGLTHNFMTVVAELTSMKALHVDLLKAVITCLFLFERDGQIADCVSSDAVHACMLFLVHSSQDILAKEGKLDHALQAAIENTLHRLERTHDCAAPSQSNNRTSALLGYSKSTDKSESDVDSVIAEVLASAKAQFAVEEDVDADGLVEFASNINNLIDTVLLLLHRLTSTTNSIKVTEAAGADESSMDTASAGIAARVISARVALANSVDGFGLAFLSHILSSQARPVLQASESDVFGAKHTTLQHRMHRVFLILLVFGDLSFGVRANAETIITSKILLDERAVAAFPALLFALLRKCATCVVRHRDLGSVGGKRARVTPGIEHMAAMQMLSHILQLLVNLSNYDSDLCTRLLMLQSGADKREEFFACLTELLAYFFRCIEDELEVLHRSSAFHKHCFDSTIQSLGVLANIAEKHADSGRSYMRIPASYGAQTTLLTMIAAFFVSKFISSGLSSASEDNDHDREACLPVAQTMRDVALSLSHPLKHGASAEMARVLEVFASLQGAASTITAETLTEIEQARSFLLDTYAAIAVDVGEQSADVLPAATPASAVLSASSTGSGIRRTYGRKKELSSVQS